MNKCLNCEKPVNNKFCSISCQNKHQNAGRADKKYGELKLYTVECGKCKKSFEVKEREKLFPQKEIYYCDRSCANIRVHSEETKNKIGESLKIMYKETERPLTKKELKMKVPRKQRIRKQKMFKICQQCGNGTLNKGFCSRSCATTWNNIHLGIGRLAGLASVSAQSESRRSKNEIYFGELCANHFKEVKFNEPMFNGWDADVIIEDIKTAVLWNGKWHYSKIKEKHSVEQVQNRDKIKQREITEKGYQYYVIKDMGKYNRLFVENKFAEFLCNVKLFL